MTSCLVFGWIDTLYDHVREWSGATDLVTKPLCHCHHFEVDLAASTFEILWIYSRLIICVRCSDVDGAL